MLGRLRRAARREQARRKHLPPEVKRHKYNDPYTRKWVEVFVWSDAEFCATHARVWQRMVGVDSCAICKGEFVKED